MTVNRVVAMLTALLGVGAAVAPVLANTDWTSTAGILVGAGLACAVALKWLDGWQKHEAREASLTAWPQEVDASSPEPADSPDEHDPELDDDPEFGALLAGIAPIAEDEDPPDDKDAPAPPAVDEVLPVTTHAHMKD